jgi:eukaryotic-like serine/threonine-protein kinase
MTDERRRTPMITFQVPSLLMTLAFGLGAAACAATTPPATANPVEPAASATASAAAVAAGPFTPLFNGKDTTGWVQILDSKWVVQDGVLVARQDPSGRRGGESWLFTEKDYADFVLRVRFRITPGGNSGIFLRDPLSRAQRTAAADGGQGPWEAGYEVNINNDEPVYPTGSVWDAAKGPGKLQKENEWNDVLIKIQGQSIWTWVNGRVALDGAPLPPRSSRGGIGFQRHGTPAYRDKVIEIKDVEIREL